MAGPSGSAAASGPLNNFAAIGAPTLTNDSSQGYAVGSRWLRAATGEEWTCRDATTGAAKWALRPPGDNFFYVAGRRYFPAGVASSSPAAQTVNVAYGGSIVTVRQRISIDQLGAVFTDALASRQFSAALYSIDLNTNGLNLAASIPATANASATSVFAALSASVVLEPGMYMGFLAATADCRCVTASTQNLLVSLLGGDVGSSSPTGYVVPGTVTVGTWPSSLLISSLSPLTGGQLFAPLIGFRVGSVGP